MAPITDDRTRAQIAGRHTARYHRASRACIRHYMADDYTDRRQKELEQIERDAAHNAARHGAYAPILDRLERMLGIDDEAVTV